MIEVENITEEMPDDGTEWYSAIRNMQCYRVNVVEMGDAAYDVYIYDQDEKLINDDDELFHEIEMAVEKFKENE